MLDFTISTFYNPRLVGAPRKQHTFIQPVWYELIFKWHTNSIDALDFSSLPTIYIHAELEIRQQWIASAPPCQRYLCVPLPTSAPARPTAMVSTSRPRDLNTDTVSTSPHSRWITRFVVFVARLGATPGEYVGFPKHETSLCCQFKIYLQQIKYMTCYSWLNMAFLIRWLIRTFCKND